MDEKKQPAGDFSSDAGLGSGGGSRDYVSMLTEGHAETASHNGQGKTSRLEYLGEYIFDFTTYESEYSEMFAKKAIDVCAAINARTTFEYIKEPESRRWYLLMVNMPFFYPRLNWGGSIRGAWWDTRPNKQVIEFSTSGLFLGGEQIDELTFTVDQWREFIAAVVAFGLEEPNVLVCGP
jgi:hypothetical protein